VVDFGRYRLTGSLGRGRVTEAFKAKSFGVEGFEKTLVVKRFREELVSDPELLALVVLAAQQSMRLSHANVAQVFDMGVELSAGNSSHYIATEFVPGLSLRNLLDRSRAAQAELPVEVLLFLAAEIAKALDHAQRSLSDTPGSPGILHGALTPDNVLISWEGEVKVSDFGLVSAIMKRGPRPSGEGDLDALALMLKESAGVGEVGPESWRFLEAVFALPSSGETRTWGGIYEALMEVAYSIRVQPAAEALAELVEKFRVTPLTDPPARFEGAFEPQGESLPPRTAIFGVQPKPEKRGGQAIVALALRFGEGPELGAAKNLALEWLLANEARVVTKASREIEAFWLIGAEAQAVVTLAARSSLEILLRGAKLDPMLSAGLELGEVHLEQDSSVADDENGRMAFASSRALALSFAARLSVGGRAAEYLQGWFELELSEPDSGVWLVGQLRPLHSATRFVGRKQELSELGSRLVKAVRGASLPIAIVGGGGIGKSRLLREMRRRLKKGTVSVGFYLVNCRVNSSSAPYSALGDMLRKLCGVRENDVSDWAALVQPRLRTLGLGEEEVQSILISLGSRHSGAHRFNPLFLESGVAKMLHSLSLERPHLFAFDRAEHLDVPSAELLGGVVARLKHSRTLLVFAGRAGNVGFLRKMPGYSEIALGPLNEEEILRLVEHGTGVASVPQALVEFVAAQSGGHPMVAIELLREGIEQGFIRSDQARSLEFSPPVGWEQKRPLKDLLEQRLAALSVEEQRVLAAVVVLDEPVELGALAEVAELPLLQVVVIVDDLEVRGLVQRLSPGTLAIAVQVLAEVVAEAAGRAEWQALHARAARHYQARKEALGAEAVRRVAQHLEAAGKREEARIAYGESGLELLGQGLLELTARHLGRALALTPSDSKDLEVVAAWVSGLLACAPQAPLHDLAPSVASAGDLLLRGGKGTPEKIKTRLLDAVLDAAELLASLHRFREAEGLVSAVLVESLSFPKLARRGLLLDAAIASSRSEFPRAVRALERAAELGSAHVEEKHRLLLALSYALAGAGMHTRALGTLLQAEELSGAVVATESCRLERTRAFLLACGGEHAQSAEAAGRAAELAKNSGNLGELALALHDESVALLLAGELPKSYATCNRAHAAAAQIGSQRLLNVCRLLLAYLEGQRDGENLGDSGAIEATLREAMGVAEEQGWTGDLIFARYLLGRWLVLTDQPTLGTEQIRAALALAESVGNQRWSALCGKALA